MPDDLAELKDRVERLEAEVAGLKAIVGPTQVNKALPPTLSATPPLPLNPAVPASNPTTPPPAPRPPTKKRQAVRDGTVEQEVAGIWFNRIAVVLLLLSAIYGFSWAVENEYIGPAGRIAIGFLAALSALGLGYRANQKGHHGWSLGITGGGVALLYISTYAARDLYGLIPYGAAFGLMVLFAIFTAVLSLYYNAQPIAWMGAMGGYLTPFILASNSQSPVGLYSYTALLGISILTLAAFRKWRPLYILGLAATWSIFGLGVLNSLGREVPWTVWFGFATLFFSIFAAVPILFNLVQRKHANGFDLAILFGDSLIYFGIGLAILFNQPQTEAYTGLFAISMALLYVLMGYTALRRHREDPFLALSFLSLSGLFLTVAIPVQLSGDWVSIAWSVEAAGLIGIGLHLKMNGVRFGGLAVMLVACVSALGQLSAWVEPTDTTAILLRSFTVGMATASLWVSAWLHNRYRGNLPHADLITLLLGLAANAATLIWWTAEISLAYDRVETADWHQLQSARAFSISALWAAYSLVLFVIGILGRMRPARLLGMTVMGFTLLKVAFIDIWALDGGWRVLGLLGTGLIVLGISYLSIHFKDRIMTKEG